MALATGAIENLVDMFKQILLLLAVGLILSHIWYQGPNMSFDDASYVKFAAQALNGTYNVTESPYAYGSGFVWSVQASDILFHNPATMTTIEYLLLIIFIYVLCSKYYKMPVALTIALSVEVSAFVLMYATRVLPDMLLGLAIMLAMTAFAYQDKIKITMLGILSAGQWLGYTIFIKFGGASIIVAILASMFLIYKDKRIFGVFLLGVCIILGIYQLHLPAGSNTFQLMQSYDALQVRLSTATLSSNLFTILVFFAGYDVSTGYFSQVFPLGFFFIIALIGMVLALRLQDTITLDDGTRRTIQSNQDIRFFALALMISLLYLFLGSASLTNYTSITIVSRYFIILLPFMAVTGGLFVSNIYDWLEKHDDKKATYMVLAGIVLLVIISNIPMYIYFLKFSNIAYHFAGN